MQYVLVWIRNMTHAQWIVLHSNCCPCLLAKFQKLFLQSKKLVFVLCTLYTVHCTLYSVQFILSDEHVNTYVGLIICITHIMYSTIYTA